MVGIASLFSLWLWCSSSPPCPSAHSGLLHLVQIGGQWLIVDHHSSGMPEKVEQPMPKKVLENELVAAM